MSYEFKKSMRFIARGKGKLFVISVLTVSEYCFIEVYLDTLEEQL